MAGFKFLPVNPHLLSTSLKPDMMKNCFTYKGILKRGGGTSKFCNLEGEIFFLFLQEAHHKDGGLYQAFINIFGQGIFCSQCPALPTLEWQVCRC